MRFFNDFKTTYIEPPLQIKAMNVKFFGKCGKEMDAFKMRVGFLNPFRFVRPNLRRLPRYWL